MAGGPTLPAPLASGDMTIDRPPTTFSNDEVGMLRSFLDHYRATIPLRRGTPHRGPTTPGQPVARPRPPEKGETATVRWVLVHMVEEYARHAGHADLIRQSVDGATDV